MTPTMGICLSPHEIAHALGNLETVDITERRIEKNDGWRLFDKKAQGLLAGGGEPPGKSQPLEDLRKDDLVDPVVLNEKDIADAAGSQHFRQVVGHDLPVLVLGFLLR